MFKIYVAYLDIQANGSASYLRLSRRYENLKQESIRLQKEFGVSVDFESLVITPMQRILRYIMLVKEILKHMPQQNIEREGLEEALHNFESTANYINNHLVDKIYFNLLVHL
ncbi:MAG: hypothetical protein EZS28_051969 [Streblomastix strix]|uniref:DH domain-containing protein n=1 Tax=Streblomastix strix TaxID=222440 RepID=A0A5J4SR56_9EUKA|nr:MAG: hypothetical protein EZS28_051969 [Streblomastix strix]